MNADKIRALASRIIEDANTKIARLDTDKNGFVTIPEDRILQHEEGRIASANEFLDLVAMEVPA